MIKKTLTFEDFNGETVTEEFYFHISEADLAKQELLAVFEGGMEEKLRKAVEKGNAAAIVDLFEFIIKGSIGEKSADGKKFFKNQEIIDSFVASNAYSVLFMELVTDAVKGAEFINGVVPANLADKIKPADIKVPALGGVKGEPDPVPTKKPGKKQRMTREEILAGMRNKTQPRVLEYKDIVEMSQEDLDSALDAGAIIAE